MKLINWQTGQPIEVDTNWVIYNLQQIIERKNDFMAFYVASTLIVNFGTKAALLQISDCDQYPERVRELLARIYLKAKDRNYHYYDKAWDIVWGT